MERVRNWANRLLRLLHSLFSSKERSTYAGACARYQEFMAREEESSDDDFIQAAFWHVLGRPADPEGHIHALQGLQQRTISRGWLLGQLASSTEYQEYEPVRNLYEELLGRQPTLFERDAMRRLRLGELTLTDLRRSVEGTMEHYFFQTPPPPAREPYQAPLPLKVALELTTRCNIVPPCVMCARVIATPDSKWRTRNMDPHIWQELLPVLRQAESISLFGGGEPLVYPHLFPLLRELDPGRSQIGFNTNGLLLTRENWLQLIERRLAWLSISIDAATPEMYRHIRRRTDFDQLLDKIRLGQQLKTETGSRGPNVEINMTVMRTNLPEAPLFVELAAKLGADSVMFQQIQPGNDWVVDSGDGYRFDYRREELHNCLDLHAEIMGRAWERGQELGVPVKYEIVYAETGASWPQERTRTPTCGSPTIALPPFPATPFCREPWQRLLVNVQGDETVFCCYNKGVMNLGNVLQAPFEELWNGSRARLVRQLILQGQVPQCCQGCFRISGSTLQGQVAQLRE